MHILQAHENRPWTRPAENGWEGLPLTATAAMSQQLCSCRMLSPHCTVHANNRDTASIFSLHGFIVPSGHTACGRVGWRYNRQLPIIIVLCPVRECYNMLLSFLLADCCTVNSTPQSAAGASVGIQQVRGQCSAVLSVVSVVRRLRVGSSYQSYNYLFL